MGCNCKTAKNGKDIDKAIIEGYEDSKMSFLTKLKVSFSFIEFYFYFVITSVFNLMLNDKLEPSIPTRLIKKYNRY
jgi:hypothetical protein